MEQPSILTDWHCLSGILVGCALGACWWTAIRCTMYTAMVLLKQLYYNNNGYMAAFVRLFICIHTSIQIYAYVCTTTTHVAGVQSFEDDVDLLCQIPPSDHRHTTVQATPVPLDEVDSALTTETVLHGYLPLSHS